MIRDCKGNDHFSNVQSSLHYFNNSMQVFDSVWLTWHLHYPTLVKNYYRTWRFIGKWLHPRWLDSLWDPQTHSRHFLFPRMQRQKEGIFVILFFEMSRHIRFYYTSSYFPNNSKYLPNRTDSCHFPFSVCKPHHKKRVGISVILYFFMSYHISFYYISSHFLDNLKYLKNKIILILQPLNP